MLNITGKTLNALGKAIIRDYHLGTEETALKGAIEIGIVIEKITTQENIKKWRHKSPLNEIEIGDEYYHVPSIVQFREMLEQP